MKTRLLVLGLLVFILAGCTPFWVTPKITVTVDPSSGPPNWRDGGLLVTFRCAGGGDVYELDPGDGSGAISSPTGIFTHLYTKVGKYVALVRSQGVISEVTVEVLNDPPEIYPPFIVNAPPRWRGKTILDARFQQHGCDSSGVTQWFGVRARSWEEIVYEWRVKLDTGLIVTGEGPLVAWFPGIEGPPPYPVDMPTLTTDGLWAPQCDGGNCDDDPWENHDFGSAVTKATITLTITNQFGSTATVTREVTVYGGEGCNSP